MSRIYRLICDNQVSPKFIKVISKTDFLLVLATILAPIYSSAGIVIAIQMFY